MIIFRLKEEEERKNQIIAAASKIPSIGIAAAALPDQVRSKRQVLPQPTYITPHFDDQAQSSKDR